MTPSETTFVDRQDGFQFICRTLGKIIMEKVFYNVKNLRITDESIINESLPYMELPLLDVEGIVSFYLQYYNFLLLFQIYPNS
jgi:hypothetical protein